MTAPSSGLPTTRRIAFHSALNLVGTGSPLLVALFAIPVLIDRLGVDRFGVLTIVWMLIGYLSLFDFGIGRALTKLVSERLLTDRRVEVGGLAGTGLVLMTALGIAGGLLVALVTPWTVERLLTLPYELRGETRNALLVLALAMPVVTLSIGLRGLLEAFHRFDLVNAVRTPLGVFTFLGPLATVAFTVDMAVIVAILLVGRALSVVAQWIFVRRLMHTNRLVGRWEAAAVRPLLGFGGWMTVSSTVSPLMVYLDRLLIGAMLGVAAVAYYATPYEVITKLWLLPAALLGVLFPMFSAGISTGDARMLRLFGQSILVVFVALAPITLLAVVFGGEALNLWVGAEFARNSTIVLQWLAIGVMVNSLAQIPFTVLQGGGRPDVTAKLHLAELPIYLGVFWWLTSRYGIEGAAIAWVVRAAIDAVLLFAFVPLVLPDARRWLARVTTITIGTVLLIVGVASVNDPITRAALSALTIALGIPVAVFVLSTAADRAGLRDRVRNRVTVRFGER
jgi:O-antigen/teichoic acid export membrane protein